MKKNIAIIEIDHHAEVLRNLCLIANNSYHNYKIYTTAKIWNQVIDSTFFKKNSNITVHIKNNNDNLKDFFLSHKKDINSCDLVIFSTLVSNYKLFFKLNFTTKIIIRIHDANTFLNPNKKYYFVPKLSLLIKDLSYITRLVILKREFFWRKKIFAQAFKYSLPNLEITNYVKDQNWVSNEKILNLPIPMFFTKVNTPKISKNKVVISIIGSIEERRRDYEIVFKAFKKVLYQIKPTVTVELNLLGKPKDNYGHKIIKLFRQLQYSNFIFNYYENYVSQRIFEEKINKSNFLIQPIQKHTKYTLFKETYSLTKMSGNIVDSLHYSKKTIIPNHYITPKNTEFLFDKYSSQEQLEETIISNINANNNLLNEKLLNHGFSIKSRTLELDNIINNNNS